MEWLWEVELTFMFFKVKLLFIVHMVGYDLIDRHSETLGKKKKKQKINRI